MNDDELRALAHELSADTADCPALLDRVAVGVEGRRRRRRTVAGALAAVAVVVAAPVAVLESHAGGHDSTVGVEAGCAGAPADCTAAVADRADRALRRANPFDFASSRLIAQEQSCTHRAYCRGPV